MSSATGPEMYRASSLRWRPIVSRSRAFSIAITTCSANVATSPTLRLRERHDLAPTESEHADDATFLEDGHTEQGADASELVGGRPYVLRIVEHIADLGGPTGE